MEQKLNWNFDYTHNNKQHSTTKYVIYKIENTISGKTYIGQTKRELRYRWADYKYNLLTPIKKEKYEGTNIKLKRSVQKHFNQTGNIDFLKFSIIEVIDINPTAIIEEKQQKLFEREKFWIIEYKKIYGINKIFNVLEGSYQHSFTNKEKNTISESKKKFYQTAEGIELKEKLSKIHTGKVLSEEHKQKLRESHKGLFSGEKHPLYGKIGDLNPMFGKKQTKESKKKMSENRKGKNVGVINHNTKIYDLSLNPLVSPTGEIFTTIESLNAFCVKHNLHTTHLRNVIKGKNKSHKSWKLLN